MHVHFTNQGNTRVSISQRNIEYILAAHDDMGRPVEPQGALDSPDVYRDDVRVFGRFLACVGSHGKTVMQFRDNDVIVLYDRTWLEQALEELENGAEDVSFVAKEYTVLNQTKSVVIAGESDTTHYSHRESWMEEGERPPSADDDDEDSENL